MSGAYDGARIRFSQHAIALNQPCHVVTEILVNLHFAEASQMTNDANNATHLMKAPRQQEQGRVPSKFLMSSCTREDGKLTYTTL